MRLIDADAFETRMRAFCAEAGFDTHDLRFSCEDMIANTWGNTIEAIPEDKYCEAYKEIKSRWNKLRLGAEVESEMHFLVKLLDLLEGDDNNE